MSNSMNSGSDVNLKSSRPGDRIRLGFVGVGKHAKRLADTFLELGASVVYHDRESSQEGPPWAGKRVPWEDMVASPEVDAVVAVATPDVTGRVAAACTKAGKPCLATKPFTWEAPKEMLSWEMHVLRSRLHVDLWRLHSPAWQAMKAELRGKAIESIEVVCVGDGPVREFSGVLDYGPHALAFVGDLLGSVPEKWEEYGKGCPGGEMFRGVAHDFNPTVRMLCGNGAQKRPGNMRVVVVTAGEKYERRRHEWWEVDEQHTYYTWPAWQGVARTALKCDRSLALRAFCRSFLAGEPSDTLRLSCEGMRVLSKVAL